MSVYQNNASFSLLSVTVCNKYNVPCYSTINGYLVMLKENYLAYG